MAPNLGFLTPTAALLHALVKPNAGFDRLTLAGVSLLCEPLLILGGHWLADYLAESKHLTGWIVGGMLAVVLIAYVWRVLTWTPRGQP